MATPDDVLSDLLPNIDKLNNTKKPSRTWGGKNPRHAPNGKTAEIYLREHPEVRCKAIIRARNSPRRGEQCGHWVVPGYPVCRYHGGNPKDPGGVSRVKNGKNSKAIMTPTALPDNSPQTQGYRRGLGQAPDLLEMYDEYLNDPELMGLRNDIAMSRALLTEYLKARSDPNNPVMDLGTLEATQKHLITLSEQITRMVERKNRIDFSEQHTITLPALVAYAARIADIINTRVSDEGERLLIAGDLRVLFGGRQANPSTIPLLQAINRANSVDGEFTEISEVPA